LGLPQIVKSAPIIKEAVRRGVGLDVVHTGQHYDYEMSRVFFNELGLLLGAIFWGVTASILSMAFLSLSPWLRLFSRYSSRWASWLRPMAEDMSVVR
jgi:hypothetical protein